MPLIYEARQGSNGWRKIGMLFSDSPAGSIAHTGAEGEREIIVFTCNGETSIIAISRGGVDQEVGLVREITSIGFDVVATLADGEEFVMPVKSRHLDYDARWRHER